MTVPVMLLCFLNPFVFLLPSSSGERISYTITMFLSLAVYMTLIGDILPKVSENMAGMSYFLLAVLFYSGLLIILTIFTLRCESIADVSQFPRWLRHLARCSCKLKKTKVVSRTKSAKVFTVRELGENEDDTAIDDDPECLCIQHKDVMGVIDRSLFVSSLLAISVITAWFLLTYHS
ncbi:neuronal acetylcholine receptor subunit alpha-7-like [Pecten maximus]|uniref:neuronal acetylcholine receptor subunit alpha-7-like n=1 Tax=Pecten maximus TaxID=6579 RepID=UPI0014590268|nr:neuronal acetylcholine receptor subunit alpha-7-like [Pecten maximus]